MNITILTPTPNRIHIHVQYGILAKTDEVLMTDIMRTGTDEFWSDMDQTFGKPVADLIRATPEWKRIEYEIDARFTVMEEDLWNYDDHQGAYL